MKFNKQLLTMGVLAILATPFVAFSTATASPLLDTDVFSAIDGETDYSNSGQRTNFNMSVMNTGSLHSVLRGVDGEYDSTAIESMRTNYSLSPSKLDSSSVDSVLSGVDGEYFE